MKKFFTILGGMGTMATESYVRLLNSRTQAHSDQEYLNYVLVNHATTPDRTAFILDNTKASPVVSLKEDIAQHSLLHPDFFVLTCNTAHYFHDELQASTEIPILHMPREAAKETARKYGKEGEKLRVALLATMGTVTSGVYTKEFSGDNFETVYPDKTTQEKVNQLIYRDIKENNFLNVDLYYEILETMITKEKCDVAILGCTELSLMQEATQNNQYPVVDAQSVLVDKTIELALECRQNK